MSRQPKTSKYKTGHHNSPGKGFHQSSAYIRKRIAETHNKRYEESKKPPKPLTPEQLKRRDRSRRKATVLMGIGASLGAITVDR